MNDQLPNLEVQPHGVRNAASVVKWFSAPINCHKNIAARPSPFVAQSRRGFRAIISDAKFVYISPDVSWSGSSRAMYSLAV